MSEEEKEEMELNIEAKYVGRTEKEFLNIITYSECLYILNTKNNYCDDIKNLSLLKIVDIISKLQKENSELTNELKHISKLFGKNTKRLEIISRKLGLTKKNEYGFLYDEIIKEINKLQKELDKKDKVINLMAEDRAEISEPKVSKEAIIDFYFKKAEEENE